MDTLSVDDEAVASNYEKDHGQLCHMTEEYIKTRKPNLLAVIYDQIDHTGHAAGHDTPAYYETLSRVDGYIGRIVQALKDEGIYDITQHLLLFQVFPPGLHLLQNALGQLVFLL